MPQRKFRMFLASKNTQTTAYHRFHATRQNPKNANFQMNGGCCGNRNPLKGWRKEAICCNTSDKLDSGTGWGYQMVLKNVQSCCKPSQLKMIQNRAASSPAQTKDNSGIPFNVSGKIDRKYNYNYRQYLKKRCMIADYDNRSGARQKKAVDPDKPQSVFGLQAPCCSDCSGSQDAPNALNLHYKRSNWGFRKQGAVDNGLYIATKKIYANPCCAGKLETDRDPNNPVTPEPPNPPNLPNPQDQNQPKKEEVEVPRPPVLAKEAGKVVKNGGGVKK